MENEYEAMLRNQISSIMDKIENEEPGSVHYGKLVGNLEVLIKEWRGSRSAQKAERQEEQKETESVIWRILENGPVISAAAGLLGVVAMLSAETAGKILTSSVKSFIRFK